MSLPGRSLSLVTSSATWPVINRVFAQSTLSKVRETTIFERPFILAATLASSQLPRGRRPVRPSPGT